MPGRRVLPFERLSEPDMRARADAFLARMRTRRSVRDLAPDPIPLDVLRTCIEAAAGAPSGANKQPWTFVVVTDPGLKLQIREGAEEEERAFYGGRASDRWISDLEPLGTDWRKPFLTTAPALVVVFAQKHGSTKEDLHYYVNESVGIAVGFFIAALHHAGLATLTHTPSPMHFLAKILKRPANERPYLLLPVGYPAKGATVPDIERKPLTDVLVER